MAYIVGDELFGPLPEPGYYVVLFAKRIFREQREEFVYFDGKRMSTGQATLALARRGYPKGSTISQQQMNRRPLIYWRPVTEVTNTEALLKALGKSDLSDTIPGEQA